MMSYRMTLEQLRIFVAVAERLHMTRAAEALGVTQSAASAAVAALEARYDVRLFDRVGRGLVLSQAGQVFLPEASAVLNRAGAAEQALQDLTGLKRGAITLAASQTVASYWLPQRMARFAAAYPGVTLTLTVANTAQVAQAIIEGSAELGFVEGEVDAPVLARKVVAGDRIELYAAPFHPLAAGPVTVEDLKAAVWVMREPGSGTRAALERALTGLGVEPRAIHTAMALPSNEAVLAAVADGGLVAAVSELAAQPLVAAGRLARLPLDLVARDFLLLTHRERRPSAAGAAFVGRLSDGR
jgi:DNA-binding transcriptional LysR family regulator